MELSRFLQSSELLTALPSMQSGDLRACLVEYTRRWYEENHDQRNLIEANLTRFGLTHDNRTVDELIGHIALHYYEKLMPLCLGARRFHAYIKDHINSNAAVSALTAAQSAGKAVLCAAPHFGGVELIVPSLATSGFALTAALRFKTEQLSNAAHAHAQAFAQSGLFAPISFIEVGKPGTYAALDMAAVLRRKGVLMSVFDEKTDYSIPVPLFGTRVWGGAGLDKLIKFAGADTSVFAAFMIRHNDERYTLELDEIAGGGVPAMYERLENHAHRHPEQWYFLHEEIPFADNEESLMPGRPHE